MKPSKALKQFGFIGIALTSLFLNSGCSPKSLFGSGVDQSVLNTPNYRPINHSCAGLNISSSQMSQQELRALVKCFNAYGALDPVQKLLDKLPDSAVDTLAQMGNRRVLGDHSFLYNLERSLEDEKSTGALDASMNSVALLFQNPKLVSSALSLLASDDDSVNEKTMDVLQTLSAHITADSFGRGIELGMNLSGAKAFAELQKNLLSNQSAGFDLKALSDVSYGLLQESEAPDNISMLDEISQVAGTGDLFRFMDALLGSSSLQIAQIVPALSPIIPTLTQGHGELLQGVSRLFAGLQAPIPCLDKTQRVSDPVLKIFGEIARQPQGTAGDYIRHTHLLSLVAMEPFCTYPKALTEQYGKIEELANSPAMDGFERVIRASYQEADAGGNRPMVQLIKRFFLDPRTSSALPLLQELSAKDAWSNLILLADVPNDQDRQSLASALSVLTQVKDPLNDILLAAGRDRLFAFASAIRDNLGENEAMIYPMLDGLRSGLDSDDAHPFVDFVRKLMADAKQEQAFFKVLFKMAEMPEFENSLRLFSTMGKDGRLKELFSDVVTLFHGYAKDARHPVTPDVALPFLASRRHDLSAKDLPFLKQNPVSSASNDVCSVLTPSVQLDQSSDPRKFKRQWDEFLDCLAEKGDYSDVKSAVNYLQTQKAENGASELEFAIDLTREFGKSLSTPSIGYLGDAWAQSEDDGSFNHYLNAAARWTNHSTLKPVLELATRVLTKRTDLNRVESFAAKTLRREDFPSITFELDRLSRMKPEPSTEAPRTEHDMERIERWIRNKECEDPIDPSVRAQWLIHDYEENPTSFENIGLVPRTGWTFDEVKNMVEPFLKKLTDPAQNRPEHTLIDSVLAFLRYFSLEEGQKPNSTQHFTRQWFANWFYDRATDRRLVPLFYLGDPPDANPHVHYLDTLDRLEILIINSDFDALGFMNLGKKFLADIADSWGDEPYEIWPDEIKAKYADSTPPTLSETVANIRKTMDTLKSSVGFPDLPNCSQEADPRDPIDVQQAELDNHLPTGLSISLPDVDQFNLRSIKRRIYNVAQVLDVLTENLPDSGTPMAGGLKLLRDLFFQIKISTPDENQGQHDGFVNNLSLVSFYSSTGIDRQLAFDLRRFERNDPVLRDYFGALVSLAQAPRSKELLQVLLRDDSEHQLIWSLGKALHDEMGNPIPSKGPRIDALRMKQSLYYGLASLEELKLVPPLVQVLPDLVKDNLSYFVSQSDQAVSALTSQRLAWLTRALHSDRDAPPKEALAGFMRSALEEPMLASSAISLVRSAQDIPLSSQIEIPQEILGFFEGRSRDPRAPEAARSIRNFLADHLENGDFDQILLLISRNPAEFEKLLDTASKYVKNGELKNFFAYLRRETK